MSGDSDDEVAASLVENADAPLSRGAVDLDDSLNTRTLADIYMEQGVYSKALEIYSDLAKKNPDNAEIKSRLEEVQKLCREKFGEG
jgi:tetratricopeptide (TPR) repeat protein